MNIHSVFIWNGILIKSNNQLKHSSSFLKDNVRQYFQALVSEETNKCTEVFAFFLPRRCADQNSNGEEKRGIFAFQLIPRSYAKVHREERTLLIKRYV